MKNLLYTLIFFLALPVYSQQNFASISFGATLPLGSYGETEDLTSSGYARTGGAIKFDAAWFPVSYLGFGASFGFGSNYALGDEVIVDIIKHLQENRPDIGIPEGATIDYVSGFWNYINLFLGPHFSIRATQRLYFDMRLLGGLSILKLPDQELYIEYDGNEIFTTASNSSLSFGFTGGAGLRFKLNDMLALKLAADYFQTRAQFDYSFELFEGVGGAPPVEARFPLQTMEFTAGLAYSF